MLEKNMSHQKIIIVSVVVLLVVAQAVVFAFWIGQENQSLKGESPGKTDDSSIFKGLGSLIPTWRKTIRCTRDVGTGTRSEITEQEMISDGESVLITSKFSDLPNAIGYQLYTDGELYAWSSDVDRNKPSLAIKISKVCREELKKKDGFDPFSSTNPRSSQLKAGHNVIYELTRVADAQANVDAMQTVFKNNFDREVKCEVISDYHFAPPPSNVSFRDMCSLTGDAKK